MKLSQPCAQEEGNKSFCFSWLYRPWLFSRGFLLLHPAFECRNIFLAYNDPLLYGGNEL